MMSNLKCLVKSLLPTWAVPYARRINSVLKAWNYWSAFVFKDGRANPPVMINFDLTYRCNLKCAMCPQAIDFNNPDSLLRAQLKATKELETDEILGLIDQAAELGTKGLLFTGGEPFLRKDIIDILEKTKKHNMVCQLISNGGLMKESYARDIVRLGVDNITFSMDGPEEIHNEIRRNKKQFQDLLKAVRMVQAEKKLQKKKLPELTFNVTVSALNETRLSELVDIALQEEVNLNYGFLFYTSKEMEEKTRAMLSSTGGKIEDQDVPMDIRGIDKNALSQELIKAESLAAEKKVRLNIQPYMTEPKELHNHFYSDKHAYVNRCFYPWHTMIINPYGEIYPCPMNVLMGNVKKDRLSDVWNNKNYRSFRKELRNVGIWPKCTKCCVLTNKLDDKLPVLKWYWDKNGH